ncbi:DUF4326 domain-containing protein [Streptomyces sp. ISL-22]|uniref:DUF4326 domain-containing protein n=1 Tax=unclassified Streptomyces TaxID=2593676 RepID=UPI001BEAA93F|nr:MULTISPECIES: DUF4326 domain-containing protein [unclassified Streptomyces]MBT2420574.1 DUF4326 domain-containing protein [Streptomyces sp. ISL-24]MBT2438263.1 DUF4326 domain-containing protein [Streptomyces sp. ISL-22]
MTTRRVRVQGDYFHPQLPPGAVYVGRRAPHLPGHALRNPYSVKACGSPQEAVRRYRRWLLSREDLLTLVRDLRGQALACWCPLDRPCHVDVIAELADAEGPQTEGAS